MRLSVSEALILAAVVIVLSKLIPVDRLVKRKINNYKNLIKKPD